MELVNVADLFTQFDSKNAMMLNVSNVKCIAVVGAYDALMG